MIRIMQSPLTNTILARQVDTKTHMWKPNKYDVTVDALVAVAKHVSNFGQPVEIALEDGTTEFEVTVKDFRVKGQGECQVNAELDKPTELILENEHAVRDLEQQAKGVNDFKEWVLDTDKNSSGLDVRDISLIECRVYVESLISQAKALKEQDK